MTPNPTPRDVWRWPAVVLWLVFFLLGLWPEFTFETLRWAGYVFTQNAIINSYNFITWSLTAFFGYFIYHRCVEAGLPPLEALGKAIQLGVLGFVAFIDLPIEQINHIRYASDRVLVMGTVGLKLLVWGYLFVLLVRYYWRGDPRVIARALPYFALTTPINSTAAEDTDTARGNSEKRSSAENAAD